MKSALIAPPCNVLSLWDHSTPLIACAISKSACSTRVDESSVGTSNAPADARAKVTTTSAQAVEMPITEHRSASSVSTLPARLLSKALTPYNADGWRDLLIEFHLSHKHPTLLDQLMHGFW